MEDNFRPAVEPVGAETGAAEPRGQGGAEGFGLSANALKLIAIIAMTVDHIADSFVEYNSPLYIFMRAVGRITGPTMFFLVAEGYRRTRNVNRYTLRLFVFALVSYLPFLYLHAGGLPNAENWMYINVIWTILCGLLAIRVRHELRSPVLQLLALIALIYLCFLGDWGTTGLLMMLCFDYFYGDFKRQALFYTVLIFVDAGLMSVLVYPLYGPLYGMEIDILGLVLPALVNCLGMFLPLLLLSRYNGRKGGGGAVAKWSFYIYYPLHLLVLGLIKFGVAPLLGGGGGQGLTF